jgi:hypothetical protein
MIYTRNGMAWGLIGRFPGNVYGMQELGATDRWAKGKRPRRGLGNECIGLGSGFGNYSTYYWYVCRFLATFPNDLKVLSADWRCPALVC